MRLVLFCVILFLAPAGCLLLTDRFASRIEDDFHQDAAWQTARYDRIVEMYPPKAATIRNAAAIRQLKQFGSGNAVATAVCGPMDTPYKRLFDRLTIRCGEWSAFRRARNAAILGVLISVFALSLVLIARIGVKRYENRTEWAGAWTSWFTLLGIHVVLALQAAAALAGFAILLQTVISHPFLAYVALSVPWIGLLWLESHTAASYIQAEKIVKFRPKRRSRAARANRPGPLPYS